MSIRAFDIRDANAALKLLEVQLPAYRVEAIMIGTADLPPLKDTVESLQACGEAFYGFYEKNKLLGALSWEQGDDHLRICRMMVHPEHFRKGIAGQLLRFFLENNDADKIVVTTGATNNPAINLYLAHGFILQKYVKVGPAIELAWLEKI